MARWLSRPSAWRQQYVASFRELLHADGSGAGTPLHARRRRYVYQLRHTFATWALSAGENPWWIAKRMGHEDVQTLYDHYGKWMKELDAKAGLRC